MDDQQQQVDRLLATYRYALAPAPDLTVSEWADRFRVLSPLSSSEHGPWRTSRTPYLREPMDALSASSSVQEVVLVFGSQLGKTEGVNNWIGYTMDIAPGPTMMVQPTIDMAKRYSKTRVQPMIDACPSLSTKIRPNRERDGGNTLLFKEFPSGLLAMGGANAPAGLAMMSIRYLGGDEIDRWPREAGDEGSPIAIVEARTRTFGIRKKQMWTSTPTVLGESHIWEKWEQSDQRHYHVPCPHCGHMHALDWANVRYDEKDPGLKHGHLETPAVFICPSCGTGIPESTKAWWYGEDLGVWVPSNPESKTQGYQLPAFYSPLGWQSWENIVVLRHRAGKNEAKLKPWVNTVLAEPWAEQAEVPDWEPLMQRRESYRVGEVPEGGLVLTMGVDVQRDRLEAEVLAWGVGQRSWSIDYIVLPGDTSVIQRDPLKPCPWRDLEREVARKFSTAGGARLGLDMVTVDAGDQTQVVYAWVRKQGSKVVRAIKGRDLPTALGTPSWQDVTYQGKRRPNGVRLWPVGGGVIKRELYGWLRQPPPLTAEEPEPFGFCHWPEDPRYGREYFEGLVSEELRRKLVRGYTRYQWEKTRDRNEPLDVRVYNRAAALMLGLDRWSDEQWEKRRRALERAAPAPEASAPAPAPGPRRRRRAAAPMW
ncbi:MAG: phage terminase large subunit family protein [Cyanobacteria bacterium J06638_7]